MLLNIVQCTGQPPHNKDALACNVLRLRTKGQDRGLRRSVETGLGDSMQVTIWWFVVMGSWRICLEAMGFTWDQVRVSCSLM
jgi:hypothetical protein